MIKIKLDENFDLRLLPHIREFGFDVATVYHENLSGGSDNEVYLTCCREKRILITLDLDFTNPLRFSPDSTEGIIVLRPPRQTFSVLSLMLMNLLSQLKTHLPTKQLWIVEPNRIRVFRDE